MNSIPYKQQVQRQVPSKMTLGRVKLIGGSPVFIDRISMTMNAKLDGLNLVKSKMMEYQKDIREVNS